MLRAGPDQAGMGARGRCGGRSEHGNQRGALRFLRPAAFPSTPAAGQARACTSFSRPAGRRTLTSLLGSSWLARGEAPCPVPVRRLPLRHRRRPRLPHGLGLVRNNRPQHAQPPPCPGPAPLGNMAPPPPRPRNRRRLRTSLAAPTPYAAQRLEPKAGRRLGPPRTAKGPAPDPPGPENEDRPRPSQNKSPRGEGRMTSRFSFESPGSQGSSATLPPRGAAPLRPASLRPRGEKLPRPVPHVPARQRRFCSEGGKPKPWAASPPQRVGLTSGPGPPRRLLPARARRRRRLPRPAARPFQISLIPAPPAPVRAAELSSCGRRRRRSACARAHTHTRRDGQRAPSPAMRPGQPPPQTHAPPLPIYSLSPSRRLAASTTELRPTPAAEPQRSARARNSPATNRRDRRLPHPLLPLFLESTEGAGSRSGGGGDRGGEDDGGGIKRRRKGEGGKREKKNTMWIKKK